jgi:hypothetical protein
VKIIKKLPEASKKIMFNLILVTVLMEYSLLLCLLVSSLLTWFVTAFQFLEETGEGLLSIFIPLKTNLQDNGASIDILKQMRPKDFILRIKIDPKDGVDIIGFFPMSGLILFFKKKKETNSWL